MIYNVSFSEHAENDLRSIYDLIAVQTSHNIAESYQRRLLKYIKGLDIFHMRGTIRSDMGRDIRIIGFERRVSIAFIVEGQDVIIIRILYGGQMMNKL